MSVESGQAHPQAPVAIGGFISPTESHGLAEGGHTAGNAITMPRPCHHSPPFIRTRGRLWACIARILPKSNPVFSEETPSLAFGACLGHASVSSTILQSCARYGSAISRGKKCPQLPMGTPGISNRLTPERVSSRCPLRANRSLAREQVALGDELPASSHTSDVQNAPLS